MLSSRVQAAAFFCASLLATTLFVGCASKPEAPPPPVVAQPPAQPVVEKFQVTLEEGILLDYQVERKLSKVNSKSCYAFITGKLHNLSDKALSKKTVLDIAVLAQGKQLYRDITNPLADVPAGANAVFDMVVSPVFADGCPKFDRINIALRKVVL
ncbi:MAG: hypothetical protein HXX19_13125 [Rhodoferax sp.]|nr:hypothetical protein [Rhodoferax sp.]